ncbi:hypothetical protein [uncultured Bifidobacterium sp.]|uniref:hypothetical protein n=1 Tax=uncultured Bifidobacterium sp. TaxID=165187 RepID=UPI00280BEACA|nr:hypothetical protein [uncultured Bifidobacterium sp.]
MNDGVPSLDEAAAEAVRLSVGPRPEADGPSRHKGRRTLVIAVVVAVALVAGVCGYRAYENHRVSLAREACQQASATQAKAVKDYKALLGSDDTAAALKTDAKTVKDAKTVDALRQAAKAKTPAMVPCDASDVDGLDAATAAASKAEKTVKTNTKALDAAVKAVESSKLDKTVDDASALLASSDGKVQDKKTRESLAAAIKARDADAIAKAAKSVNDSKAAKEKADAEAKAKAEREAAEQAAAQQAAAAAQAQAAQQRQAQRSYTPSYSTGAGSGYSYSKPSGGSTGSSSGSTGGSSDGFVPISGAHGCTDDCPPPSSDGLIHH